MLYYPKMQLDRVRALPSKESNLGELVYQALEVYFEQHQGVLPAPGLYERIFAEVERPLLFLTLRAVSGNQQKAAEILGINRNTLRKKIRQLMQTRESTKALHDFAQHALKDL